ncbi:potassium voltage-gated channel protein Shab-like [Gigantopelta aegis]|uniref:potassium voltage-gated channel protein Shab-like n=1 Tax=Gigantopelta aegis TaxID=1735272 RepID=UPI001B88DBE7|nr:potassium voltage-gated channel protein Shab-like [Gigantopelta aegis]XP_041366364.1 potassium voltage-gated channel protein Shab-like [Gigantopelta aegis]XP_041366365.1 potassium voltage-gated channel protein Shab-like [Gigantopelta aegis]
MEKDTSDNCPSSSAEPKRLSDHNDKAEPSVVNNHNIILNIRGEHFVVNASILEHFPNTRLGRLAKDPNLDEQLDENGEIFYNKDPIMFGYIMDFYRGEELHVPKDKCVVSVEEDLEYWGIEDSLISLCCRKRFLASLNELYKTEQIKRELASLTQQDRQTMMDSPIKQTLVTIFNNRKSSRAEKVWSCLYPWLIILTVGLMFFSTHPNFRVALSSAPQTQHGAFSLTNKQVELIVNTKPHIVLVCLEFIFCVIFTVELLFNALASCKHIVEVFNMTTLCTVVYLVPAWISLLTQIVDAESSTGIRLASVKLIIHALTVLRVALLHRLIWHNRDLRLLFFALKSSIQELTLMMVFVLSVAVMSSSFLFATNLFVDSSIDSMFTGLWWAVVTITTVGYGDQHPHSWLGYIVACVCILTGIIVTGMSIPLITKRFHVYYQTRLPADINHLLKRRKSRVRPCSCKLLE